MQRNTFFKFDKPRSLNQAHAWSPEGKMKSAPRTDWANKTPKERKAVPPAWTSRNKAQTQRTYDRLRREAQFNH